MSLQGPHLDQRGHRPHVILFCAIVLLFAQGCAVKGTGGATAVSDSGEIQRLGERMYREGILPDGSPLQGMIRGDVAVDGTVFSCSSCHGRGGLGSVEGVVVSPPVNGTSLFNPGYLYKDYIKNVISRNKGVVRTVAQPIRSAYTDASLSEAIRFGVNADGRELLPVMPRYDMTDRDMAVLAAYLHTLSSAYSPGVTETSLHLATIVTDDVSADDRQAMLEPIEMMVAINQQSKTQQKLPQFAKMFRMLDRVFFRDISLSVWELKGPPDTWRRQLEEYDRREPAFAVLGGISGQSWQPIHEFCESQRIPCLFPITDLPVVSDSSWYTFYASKGYFQEGETAARFMAGRERSLSDAKVLQVVGEGPESEALAAGFNEAWSEGGATAPVTVRIEKGRRLSAGELMTLLRQHGPATLVLWAGPEAVTALEEAARSMELPETYVSSRSLGDAVQTLPEGIRERTFITYPFRMPEEEKVFAVYADVLALGRRSHRDTKRIATRAFSMVHMFLLGLKELRLDFYRDNLIDLISMQPDQYLPDFERYSFGLGQRYASKGCYIVQLSKGPDPRLLRKSDWIVF